MELTPRVEKIFLSRERATFLTSSNKVHTLEKSQKCSAGETRAHSIQTTRSCLSSSSTTRSRSISTRRSGARGRERRWSPRSLNQRKLSLKSDPTSVRFLHSYSFTASRSIHFLRGVRFISDLGTEAPAAIGDASGH